RAEHEDSGGDHRFLAFADADRAPCRPFIETLRGHVERRLGRHVHFLVRLYDCVHRYTHVSLTASLPRSRTARSSESSTPARSISKESRKPPDSGLGCSTTLERAPWVAPTSGLISPLNTPPSKSMTKRCRLRSALRPPPENLASALGDCPSSGH